MPLTPAPLPPLQAVRVFDAAARLKSFSRAADELGMTQAAVSYQIRQLEDRVGSPLFVRQPRGVSLTSTGRVFASKSAEALEILREAFAEARESLDATLVISVLATFATYVLGPRLGLFQIAHPRITTRIDVNHALVDLQAGEATVAIRAGGGQWDGLRADLLMRARYTPMLSPGLLKQFGPLKEPADILRLPFVDATDPSWENWFRAAGVSRADAAIRSGPSLGSQVLEAQAALAGHGVCLLTPAYFGDALRRGDLVQPFDIVSEDDMAIWLVYPKTRQNAPVIRAFRDWILEQMEEMRGSVEAADGPSAAE
ncbi:MAG: LysR substrate-binding domain-containing protein [Pseudomonadota bacterium]